MNNTDLYQKIVNTVDISIVHLVVDDGGIKIKFLNEAFIDYYNQFVEININEELTGKYLNDALTIIGFQSQTIADIINLIESSLKSKKKRSTVVGIKNEDPLYLNISVIPIAEVDDVEELILTSTEISTEVKNNIELKSLKDNMISLKELAKNWFMGI